ncbi:sensor domain-containing diguanylate cyclase [Anaerosporobacter faecicola]|uniref:sensor domain-containing diguanylate cyclase n=1 Tax=Anaerosporobacter faecicola TaxID=2718714 RepID=UPI0014394613|nr:sensor domain-containing diguanylate cyclase [Anaerosporobacter faecicola]
MNKKSIYRNKLVENVLEVIFEQNDITTTMNRILEMIGEYSSASRVYIFEDSIDNLSSENTYEWCAAGCTPHKDHLKHVSYKEIIDRNFSSLFGESGIWFQDDITKMEDSSLKERLLMQNIKATILVAIYEYDDFAGFIGVDFYDTLTELSSEQREILQVLSKLISYAMSGAKYAQLRGLARSLKERSFDLKKQMRFERKNFFGILGNSALFTVHSDLTDGLIIEDILAPDGSSLLAALGYSVPAPYDEEGRTFIEANQVEMITPDAEICFHHKEIIKLFYEGIGSAPFDIYIGSMDMYIRMNAIFYEDQDTGHVMCYCMCTNISDQYKEIRRLKELKTVNEQLKYEATHDGNTGLLNRAAGEEEIKAYINENDGKTGALILIDMDKFKLINDNYGHAVGDKAILNVAETMKKCFPQTEVLSRFGGDEFAVFIKDISNVLNLKRALADFLLLVSQPMTENNMSISLTCSVGVAIAQNGKMDFETFYRHADTALYFSKNNGRNRYHLYSGEVMSEDMPIAL